MTTHRPAHEIELYREADAYTVIVDVGDADPEEVHVTWRNGHLHVHLEVQETSRDSVRHREVSVPREVDPDGITAAFSDGVLEVTLPVISDRVHGKTIEVERN